MKTFELNAVARQETGKKATKKTRKEGKVPCILYGGDKIIHFAAPINDFRHLIYTPDVHLVNLTVGEDKYLAIIKDIQFHSVTDAILHIDFLEVIDKKPVEIGIPVQTEGFAEGVQSGGKLKIEMRRLKVSGLSENLPNILSIDVTNIALGETIKVRDLDFDNLELLDANSAVVVSVKLTRVAKGMAVDEEGEGEEGEGEEGVDGEEGEEEVAATEE